MPIIKYLKSETGEVVKVADLGDMAVFGFGAAALRNEVQSPDDKEKDLIIQQDLGATAMGSVDSLIDLSEL